MTTDVEHSASGSLYGSRIKSGMRKAKRWLGGLPARLETLFEAEKDQLPLWLPVGLISGIGGWFWLPTPSGWIALAAVGLALGFALLSFAGDSRAGRALAWFGLAAAFGCALIWWTAERVSAPRLERAQAMEVTGTIVSVQPLAARQLLRLVVAPEGEGVPARVRVNVPEPEAPPGLAPGARVRFRAFLMPPAPAFAPGGYDFSRAAWFQRLGGTGRVSRIEILAPPTEQGWRATIADWRQRLGAHIRSQLPGAEGGIAAALATGDQFGIPEADAEAMRRSGLAHLLSVSGLHLTAVVGAVMLLTLKLLALSPVLALRYRLVLVAAGVGALAGVAYTLLTGAEVPTVRSCIAALLVLAGIALGREAITLRLVAVGALVVLLLWPESLVGPSFQLSFAAIVAIVALHENPRVKDWLSRRDEGWPMRVGRFIFGLVLTGLVVELALTPIALFHFHRAGLYGAAANVVAIPLTTFVIMPLEALALLFDLAGLGAPFWWLTGQALSFLLWIARMTAAAPGAVALLPAIPRGAFALICAGGLWLCLWRTSWRRWGLLPVAIGALWAWSTPAPDLILTGDGKHLIVRAIDGSLALLRPRAGDYVRDSLAELAGEEADYLDMDDFPAAACSLDLCAINIDRDGRRWRILATRTRHLVAWPEMIRACAQADIVISDRLLPRGCNPRWLRADRRFLERTGGLSIRFGSRPSVETVRGQAGQHPWAAGATEPPLFRHSGQLSVGDPRAAILSGPDMGDAQPAPLIPALLHPGEIENPSGESGVAPSPDHRLLNLIGIEPESRHAEIGEIGLFVLHARIRVHEHIVVGDQVRERRDIASGGGPIISAPSRRELGRPVSVIALGQGLSAGQTQRQRRGGRGQAQHSPPGQGGAVLKLGMHLLWDLFSREPAGQVRSTPRIDGNPVHLPGRPGVGRISLFEARRIGRHFRNHEPHEDGAAVDHVLTVEKPAPGRVERAVNGRGQDAVAHAREVQAPLARLGIIEAQRQALDPAAAGTRDREFHDIGAVGRKRADRAGAAILRPFGRSGKRRAQPQLGCPRTDLPIEVAASVSLRLGLRRRLLRASRTGQGRQEHRQRQGDPHPHRRSRFHAASLVPRTALPCRSAGVNAIIVRQALLYARRNALQGLNRGWARARG